LGAPLLRSDPALVQMEELSPVTAWFIPHFNKGGLGGICLPKFYMS